MNQYKFEGVVKNINSSSRGSKVKLVGIPNYYSKFDDKEYNLLWDSSNKIVKALELSQEYIVDLKDQIAINLLVASNINNKPIEVLIEEDDPKAPTVIYKIISISTLSKES